MRPRFKPQTFALWFAPSLLAFGVGWLVLSTGRGRLAAIDLTEEEAEVARFIKIIVLELRHYLGPYRRSLFLAAFLIGVPILRRNMNLNADVIGSA